jgi:hypothetical protein
MAGLEPARLRTRPSNVRVYQFHHIRSVPRAIPTVLKGQQVRPGH